MIKSHIAKVTQDLRSNKITTHMAKTINYIMEATKVSYTENDQSPKKRRL